MPHRRALLVAAMLSGLAVAVQAQINGYAQVLSIAGTTINLGVVDELNGSFEDGDQAIVMQMQDDLAGTYLTNNANYGNLYTINSGGRWEFVQILSHTENLGVPTSITVAAPTTFTYHFGAKCSVQLISFRDRGTPDFTTSAPINALPWNGTIGGVVALKVSGILTLAHDIRADGAGFRGGAPSVNYDGTCITTTYTSSVSNFAERGDGAQRVDVVNNRYARGKLITAGGGGNPRNAGGGGGGFMTSGGSGGGGYSCSAGGRAGIALNTFVGPNRFFMGGGGGGGQQNNSVGGAGGAGGGIIIVHMEMLRTEGPCSDLFISANGADGASSVGAPPDGAGGGGAGGTVFLFVNSFDIDPTCAVNCQANGGNGGGVTNTDPAPGNWVDCGGGGGGGGQGLVACGGGAGGNGGAGWGGMSGHSSSGQGGAHDPGGGHAADGVGADGSGVLGFGDGPALPVELLHFTAYVETDRVLLDWSTASEQDNLLFRVHCSADGESWSIVAEVPGSGNSQHQQHYSAEDPEPFTGLSFYRLEQVDLDGTSTLSHVVPVDLSPDPVITTFPNPANTLLTVAWGTDPIASIELVDAAGRTALRSDPGHGPLRVSQLAEGVYELVITRADGRTGRTTVVVRH